MDVPTAIPLSQIVDRVELRADARSSHPFLFTNPTAVSKTLSPSHTRGFVETVKTSSEPEMACHRAPEWLRIPRISHEVT